jgi:uncharacterized membrane protein YecN with MAPEG domain
MKNLEKLNEINNKNKIDLISLNNFLFKKGDDLLEFLLQINEYKKIDSSSDRIHNYYLEKGIKNVPKYLFNNYSFCNKAVSNYGNALQFVPKHLKDYKLCDKAVSNHGNALQFVPKHLKDYKLCEKAVSNYGNALEYVPEKLIDYALCEKAVEDRYTALEYVPENLKDYKICDKAVSNYGNVLEFVPENLRDYKICKKALLNGVGKEVLDYIPKKYMSQLIKDFPEAEEFLKQYFLQEYISKEVRKLLKEYYL